MGMCSFMSNEDVENVAKQIATFLVDINTTYREKTRIKNKIDELNLELEKLKDAFIVCEEKIRSSKHKISEYCDQPFMSLVK